MRKIKLLATLRIIAGVSEIAVDFEQGTVGGLIDQIRTVNPVLATEIVDEAGELTGAVHILVHGRNAVWLQGLNTPIAPDDIITLIPPSAGG